MPRSVLMLVLFVVGISFPGLVFATVHSGTIHADLAQTTFPCSEVTSSQGLGTVTFDDVTNTLSWNYAYGDNAPEFDRGSAAGGGSELGSLVGSAIWILQRRFAA